MVRKKQLIFFLQLAQFSIKIWLSFGLTNTPSTKKIKELLGYSKNTKSIDYLIKDDGFLKRYGVTYVKTKGLTNSKTRAKSIKFRRLQGRWKNKKEDFADGRFVILNMPIFLYMLFYINEIKVIGIYLYCYLLHKCVMKDEEYTYTKISLGKMKNETRLSENTILNYLTILRDYKLVKIKRGDYILEEFGDIIGKEINEYKVIVKLSPEEFD